MKTMSFELQLSKEQLQKLDGKSCIQNFQAMQAMRRYPKIPLFDGRCIEIRKKSDCWHPNLERKNE